MRFCWSRLPKHRRREGLAAHDAAIDGAASRLRAILMTSCAMIAGMLPMALAFGEAGQQNAPLGRAVIGGLVAATFATLFVLPSLFSMIQNRASTASASLDPTDPHSSHYGPAADSSARRRLIQETFHEMVTLVGWRDVHCRFAIGPQRV